MIIGTLLRSSGMMMMVLLGKLTSSFNISMRYHLM